MKSVLTSAIFLFSFCHSNAQIYNAGFENWTNMGNYEVPDQWGTMNNATSHLNIYTVTKWYPGSPGAYFMKITSKIYGSSVMNGIAVYGRLDSTTMQPMSGYPFTQRPTAFTGQWQHMIWGTSQGSVCATLTKWNGADRDTIGIAYEELFDMAMNWEAFSINFNYLSTAAPDSCMIVLKSSGDTPTANDYLWVDDLGFSGLIGIDDLFSESQLSVFPNPCSSMLTVKPNFKTPGKIKLEISDITGKIIRSSEGKSESPDQNFILDISDLSKGIYFLRSIIGEVNEVKKIIIE
jgi:hypothetical protein